jgi:hypothetical protein
MRKFLHNVGLYLKLFWHSLFVGMRNADLMMTTNQKNADGSGYETPDNAGGGGVFKDILEEKVTQEVEELRYTSYKVANESKKYRYVGNGKAIKKTESQLSEKHGIIEESDNLPVIVIQDNSVICEDVLTTLKEVDSKENKKVFHDHNIKIKRDLFPRFLIENYVKKVVVKQAEGNYVLDLYCSKYPSQFNEKKDRAFLTELLKIKEGKVRNSDILDFTEISFITSNAWGVDDWNRFSFIDFELYGIIEFDGNYLIRFGCQSNIFMENLLDKVYSETAEKKYQNKESRENAVIDFASFVKQEEYKISSDINLDALENVSFSVDNSSK